MQKTLRACCITAPAVLVVVGLTATGCSSPRMFDAPASGATIRPTPTSPPVPTTTEQAGWTPVSDVRTGIAVDELTVNLADGSHVTVARFRAGQTLFALHVGSHDPPTVGAAINPAAGSTVASGELPSLLAGFNGGFMMSARVGGVEVDGRILSPLVPGMASFVIDTNGSGHVGVWGQTVPAPGEQVASVRQNLTPLVSAGSLSPRIADIAAWGSTFGGGTSVARSAVGEDARGDILYAGSMAALPVDLGSALLSAGATNAMQLDINPEWVQLDLATSPGGTLTVGVPGQHRPADQYVIGWTRDFIAVLAKQWRTQSVGAGHP